jgi:hypothetical protein
MHRLWLTLCLASAAVGQYDGIEPRSVAYPSKSSLGPLYSGFSGSAAYRDNSYEDNAVTPTPSPTPIYRNGGSAQQVSPRHYIKWLNDLGYFIVFTSFCLLFPWTLL